MLVKTWLNVYTKSHHIHLYGSSGSVRGTNSQEHIDIECGLSSIVFLNWLIVLFLYILSVVPLITQTTKDFFFKLCTNILVIACFLFCKQRQNQPKYSIENNAIFISIKKTKLIIEFLWFLCVSKWLHSMDMWNLTCCSHFFHKICWIFCCSLFPCRVHVDRIKAKFFTEISKNVDKFRELKEISILHTYIHYSTQNYRWWTKLFKRWIN